MPRKIDRFTGTKFDTSKGNVNKTGKKALNNLLAPIPRKKKSK